MQLPLPPSDSGGDDKGAKEKERVHSLESAVVTWTRQIKNVLKTDPENLLKAGEHPGPLAQIKFWEAKRLEYDDNRSAVHRLLVELWDDLIDEEEWWVGELLKNSKCPAYKTFAGYLPKK